MRTAGKKRTATWRGATCIAWMAILVAAPAAFGQAAAGQYDPSLDSGGIVKSGLTKIDSGGATNGGESNGGGTEAPLTSYPMTWLVAGVGLLLAVGLAYALLGPFDFLRRG